MIRNAYVDEKCEIENLVKSPQTPLYQEGFIIKIKSPPLIKGDAEGMEILST